MTAPAKLTAFAGALAVLFGGGALAGGAFDPDRSGTESAAPSHADDGHPARQEPSPVSASRSAHPSGDRQPAAHPVRGLAVAENGLRVVVDDPELRRSRTETVRFRVVDDRDETVRDFDVEHEKRMHLIVARRDLTGFQHLHPRQEADGTWAAALRVDEPGSYRLFADFSHGDTPSTLATDLRVDGEAALEPLPEPARTATTDGGYAVRLDAGRARPGEEAELRFSITKDGRAVHTDPYLGAGGHLVALREGDLAFLHVHPTEHGDDATEHDDSVGFAATFPTEGRYRLFLQFKHEGRVQTVAFTQEVE
jgi:hypothetical protein